MLKASDIPLFCQSLHAAVTHNLTYLKQVKQASALRLKLLRILLGGGYAWQDWHFGPGGLAAGHDRTLRYIHLCLALFYVWCRYMSVQKLYKCFSKYDLHVRWPRKNCTRACLTLADSSRCCCRPLWRRACSTDRLGLLVFHDWAQPGGPLHPLPPASPLCHEGGSWPRSVCHDALSLCNCCQVS